MSQTSTSTSESYFAERWDGKDWYLIDTRLETWEDPTPRETESSLKDLREACIAAAEHQLSLKTKLPTREERIKLRDQHDQKSLTIALEVYAKENNMESADHQIVKVKERNLIDEYGEGFVHFNFIVKSLDDENTFFAELHPNIKDEKGVYLCTPLDENDKGHCYGCEKRAKGLLHPNNGGYLGGHKDVVFPFMEFSDDDDI